MGVKRIEDEIIYVKLIVGTDIMNTIIVYAPQIEAELHLKDIIISYPLHSRCYLDIIGMGSEEIKLIPLVVQGIVMKNKNSILCSTKNLGEET